MTLDFWQQPATSDDVNHNERSDQNQGNNRVHSAPEPVDVPQSTARENQQVNHREEDKLDGEIDAPELKVGLPLAPQATRRFSLRQINARQDPHPSKRHHQPPLSDIDSTI